jgi:type IV pilus assembly protein PilY1
MLALVTAALAGAPPEDADALCASGGSSLAASSTRLSTDVRLFQAGFVKAPWTGSLTAYAVNDDGTKGAKKWDAADAGKIPAAGLRTILTTSGPTAGIDFTWTALQKAGLDSLLVDEDTLNYLRGDQSKEVAKGGVLRNRTARLGAIVNSDIAYAGVENFGYEALAGAEGTSYAAFMDSKKNRVKLALVGANDGMLHGFDAANGAEKFAFVPRALLLDPIDPTLVDGKPKDPRSTLVRLSDPAFTARYYVDGSPWVGDAYWDKAWRTVVVGTTGAGGKGVFALDITDPTAMSASKVLWDLDGLSDSDLGHGFGQPVIGRLRNAVHDDKEGSRHYAIFGNGRGSSNGCAVLYLVRLDNGDVRKISTGVCDGNGLGRPSLYDAELPGDRITDFVYAGDLKGNVWRFDLRAVDLKSNPPKGAAVQLLFSAQNANKEAQPVTGAIELGVAPAGVTGSPRPVMLWFGTGRHFTDDDRKDTTVQSLYGIVDRFTGLTVLRTALQEQTINTAGGAAGTITGTAVDYKTQDGWFADLPHSGERMVGAPLLQTGRLFFATLSPVGGACLGDGSSWIYAVDPYRGIGLANKPFISAAGQDFIASTVGQARSLVGLDAGVKGHLYIGGTGGGGGGGTLQREEVRPAQQGGTRGRVSWREIVP